MPRRRRPGRRTRRRDGRGACPGRGAGTGPGGVRAVRRRAVRHLHARDAHGRGCAAARRRPASDRARGHRRARRRPLPLHRLSQDHRGGHVDRWRRRASPLPPAGAAVGARVARVDGVDQVTGASVFGADRAPTDVLHLRAVRSPHAHARFTIGDLATAVRRPSRARPGPGRGRRPGPEPLRHLRHRQGPAGASPTATSATAARRSRRWSATPRRSPRSADDELPIAWEPLEPLHGSRDGARGDAPRLHEASPGNVLTAGRVARGDVASALDVRPPSTATGTFRTSHVEHAYIEPEAGYAAREGDRITVVVSTQTPYMDRDEVALVLGIAPEQVRIVPTACGGGFGGKLDMAVQPLVAVAAWVLDRPVRCVYTRPESMRSTTKRHPAVMTATLGADADGRFTAYDFHGDFDTGAYASWGPTVANRVPVHAAGPYEVRAVRATTRAIHTNGPIGGAFRGFGVPQAAVAHEALVDDVAERARDRSAGDPPARTRCGPGSTTATGQVLEASAGLAPCLEALRPRWQEALDDASSLQRRGDGARQPDAARRRHRGDVVRHRQHVAAQSVDDPDRPAPRWPLRAVQRRAGHRSGLVDDPEPDRGRRARRRLECDRSRHGRHGPHGGRRQDVGLTPDVRVRQCDAPRRRRSAAARSRLAGPDLAALPEDADGCIVVGEGSYDPRTTPLDADGQGIPYETYGFGAQIAVVDVDLELGTTLVRRIVAAHDVGRAINPMLVEGQIHGGIAQGLGFALMEEYRRRPDRQPARLPDPDDRRHPADRDDPRRGRRAGRPVRREGRRRTGPHPDGAGDPRRDPPRDRRPDRPCAGHAGPRPQRPSEPASPAWP